MYQSRMMNEHTEKLVSALLALEDREECYRFLDDLLTIREICDLSQRIEVAQLLMDGVTYSTITQLTGASSATIGRVNRSLTYGSEGYKRVLTKMNTDNGDTHA